MRVLTGFARVEVEDNVVDEVSDGKQAVDPPGVCGKSEELVGGGRAEPSRSDLREVRGLVGVRFTHQLDACVYMVRGI